jgi:hypothetical protein
MVAVEGAAGRWCIVEGARSRSATAFVFGAAAFAVAVVMVLFAGIVLSK